MAIDLNARVNVSVAREQGVAVGTFLTGVADEDGEDEVLGGALVRGTPRMMEVNGVPCKSCKLLYPRDFLKEHERICVRLCFSSSCFSLFVRGCHVPCLPFYMCGGNPCRLVSRSSADSERDVNSESDDRSITTYLADEVTCGWTHRALEHVCPSCRSCWWLRRLQRKSGRAAVGAGRAGWEAVYQVPPPPVGHAAPALPVPPPSRGRFRCRQSGMCKPQPN